MSWKLEDAMARFSAVMLCARAKGPRAVTERGRRVVVLDAEAYDRPVAPRRDKPFVAFLESLDLEGLDLTRDRDPGRPVEL